jgi:lipopolysaccharide export LptBFGC system permease protein LptF
MRLFFSRQGRKFLSVAACLCFAARWLQAQPADTASASYQIGYYIGAWLPFWILGSVFLILYLVLRKRGEGK